MVLNLNLVYYKRKVRANTQRSLRAAVRDLSDSLPQLPGRHAVFWKQRHLQHFGATAELLLAGSGDRLPRHTVDLIEGVRAKAAFVCGTDEQLQAEPLLVVAA